jgi:hypothetical protein
MPAQTLFARAFSVLFRLVAGSQMALGGHDFSRALVAAIAIRLLAADGLFLQLNGFQSFQQCLPPLALL